ncbi:polyhydroxyalkanoate depolymerase [Paraburkholderia sp. NMBU_R16]|nr:polyhydroxyalkanoate depolymerase [Paraburkholderia sp. NMBU_R16]
MLYDWLEAQRALARSVGAWTEYTGRLFGLPVAPGGIAVPGSGWFGRFIQTAAQAPGFDIHSVTIGERQVSVKETVVAATPFCALRHFAREGLVVRSAPYPVLVCAPLAGHHAVMMREMVETLLEDTDVYVTDWANARDVPITAGRFGLDDYVQTIERFLRMLGGAGVHVLAVCQATAPAAAAAALVAACGEPAPLSLTLMGGPIDARINPTAIGRFALAHSIDWFRDTVIDIVPSRYAGAGRRVYPGYLQHAALMAAHPHRQLALESQYWTNRMSADEAKTAESRRALDEYAAVLDMTEDYFLDTLQVVFREHRLARGIWHVAGRHIDGSALARTALCTVEGDRDDITGAGQTHAAHTVLTSVPQRSRMRLTIADCDHYGLFTGARWREAIHPELARFWRSASVRRRGSPVRPSPTSESRAIDSGQAAAMSVRR